MNYMKQIVYMWHFSLSYLKIKSYRQISFFESLNLSPKKL